jgi:hypothetical protein
MWPASGVWEPCRLEDLETAAPGVHAQLAGGAGADVV